MNIFEKYKTWIGKKYNIEKPYAATWDGWEEWHEQTKAAHPWAYYFYETVPNFFDTQTSQIKNKFLDVKYWIRYRTVDRYHLIPTRLSPGYIEFNERCLHGCFEMLVDYVECHAAWHSAMFDENEQKKYPWYSKGIFRFVNVRRPKIGVNHLKWESTLDSDNIPMNERSYRQAERGREILDLYHWWKYVRPLRKEPMDLSGWSAICEERTLKGISPLSDKGRTAADRKRERVALDRTNEIEQAFEDEDTEQLIRLIKIRKGLWT